jgi:hypothetical protein
MVTPTDCEHVLLDFSSANIPVHTLILDHVVNSFGFVPEIEFLHHVSVCTRGKCQTRFQLNDLLFQDFSYVQKPSRQFIFDFLPPSSLHLSFPWDCLKALPVHCIPTRYKDYEILLPLQVIKARLRQGFLIQNAILRDKVSIHLVLHWLPHVSLQYRMKIRKDWASARVEVNVLAHSEFTLDLFRNGNSFITSESHSETVSFQEYLKSLLNQDLVHKVITEVTSKIIKSPFKESLVTFVQVIESLLKTHLDWMDQDMIYIQKCEGDCLDSLTNWSDLTVAGHFVRLSPSQTQFGFAAIKTAEKNEFSCSFRFLFYNYTDSPEVLRNGSYNGAISIKNSPFSNLNMNMLSHKTYLYSVSPSLLKKMIGLAVKHYTELGFVTVDRGVDFVHLIKDDVQCVLSSKEEELHIDLYQFPCPSPFESRDLADKLSAMYTIDSLIHRRIPKDDPLFSIKNVLTHSKMTIVGVASQLDLPVQSFSRTFAKHLSEVCIPSHPMFDHDNIHSAIHAFHDLPCPNSDFECFLYISSTLLIFFVPKDTTVHYVIVYECLVDQMAFCLWSTVELAPHASINRQSHYPLVSLFYYSGYHVSTQDIDEMFCHYAWLATAECVYSLSHQLNPAHVKQCIHMLHEMSYGLNVSRLCAAIELLGRQKSSSELLEVISNISERFDHEIFTYMRIIPDTPYFSLVEPFFFCYICFQQCGVAERKIFSLRNLFSQLIDLSNMVIDDSLDIHPPVELKLSFYSLNRDVSSVSSLADEIISNLQYFCKVLIQELLIFLNPVTLGRVQYLLSENQILPKATFNFHLLKPCTISNVHQAVEKVKLPGFHIFSVGPYFYVHPLQEGVVQTNSMDLKPSDLEEGLGIVLEKPESSNDVPRLEELALDTMKEWVIFTVDISGVTVHSFMDSMHACFLHFAQAMSHLINTKILLLELRDSHTSSKYLIQPDSPDPIEKDQKKGKLVVGQFACPIQYSTSFSLHWRLKPTVALHSVTSLLNSLAVTNRRHTFVVSQDDKVFYMRLSESSTLGAPSNASLPEDDSVATSPSTPTSSNRKLNMNLHGIDIPSKDFLNEVIQMLTSRLYNITLQHVSTYLSRTSLSRLTKADVEFLLPLSKGPKMVQTISIPEDVNIHRYFVFFRQSILLFTNILSGAEVFQTLSQHLQIRYDYFSESLDVVPGEMAFLYCCITSRNPTIYESVVGQGIGCISMYLMQKGQIISHQPMDDAKELQWRVELWPHGTINQDALLNLVQSAHHQAYFDSCLCETVSRGDFSKIYDSLIEKHAVSSHPCLFTRKHWVKIGPWMIGNLFSFLREQLPEYSFEMVQQCIVSASSASEHADSSFYSGHTLLSKGDKTIRVHVERPVMILIYVSNTSAQIVCWNIKPSSYSKIENALATFICQHEMQMEVIQSTALFKLGIKSSPQRVERYCRPICEGNEATCLDILKPNFSKLVSPIKDVEDFGSFAEYCAKAEARAQYVSSIYARWRKRHQSRLTQENERAYKFTDYSSDSEADSDLDHILRYARLIHWCRTPILFNCHVDNGFSYKPNLAPMTDAGSNYFSIVIKTVLQQYCEYLSSLGFLLVCRKTSQNEFSVSENKKVGTDCLFLQKSFQGGILLVEVSLAHVFLAVNLYTVNRRYGPNQQRLPSPGTVICYPLDRFISRMRDLTKFWKI